MKTIFFDFGNVLGYFDHLRACRPLSNYSPFTAEQLDKIIYNGPEENAYERGLMSTDDFADFARKAGQLDVSRNQFLEHFVDIFTPNPDVCSLIPDLAKTYRLVLASNTNDAHYRKYTAMFADTLGHFSALCPSHLVGHRKPQEEYFHACQKVAMAEPHECLFVDDLPVNITSAERTVGWKGLLYAKGEVLSERLQSFTV